MSSDRFRPGGRNSGRLPERAATLPERGARTPPDGDVRMSRSASGDRAGAALLLDSRWADDFPLPARRSTLYRARRPRTDFFTRLTIFLLYGYSFVGKLFSFGAIPLLALYLLEPAVLLRPLFRALTRRHPLSAYAWTFLLSLLYGIVELGYGLLRGNEAWPAVQTLLFNVMPVYLVIGLWAGVRRPDVLRTWIRRLAWYGVLYAGLYYAVLQRFNPTGPGADETFPRPGSGSWVLIGLFTFESNLLPYAIPIAVAICFTIANQIRADWLGLGMALLMWGAVTRRLGRVFSIAALVAGLLAVGFVTDVKLPAMEGRGGELSARETIARALAGIDPSLASEYSKNAGFYAGTVSWRTKWWSNIRETVFADPVTALFGLGYGYPLRMLGQRDMHQSNLRSPHNVFYFTLAYSGLVGVALFFASQIAVIRLLWLAYRMRGNIFGVAVYVVILVGAFFGNFLENPIGGTVSYLVAGLSIAPIFVRPSSMAPRRSGRRMLPVEGRRTADVATVSA